jgi:catalase
MFVNPTTTVIEADACEAVISALDSNFGNAPKRRAAHAKGVVAYGTFVATDEARTITKAEHLQGQEVEVVARFSNFPGGASHPDGAPESNPRGCAVQFRLPDGSTTDLLAHSINGFPGRTIEDFAGFLRAISPDGPGPAPYLAEHEDAAEFVHGIQTHGTPQSYVTLAYYAVNAFRFENAAGVVRLGRYTWEPDEGNQYVAEAEVPNLSFDFLAEELEHRLSTRVATFALTLSIAAEGDVTDNANSQWPSDRLKVTLGTLTLRSAAPDSDVAGRGLFFDPVRLIDGIGLSEDPLLVGRTRTYPLSLARRHSEP